MSDYGRVRRKTKVLGLLASTTAAAAASLALLPAVAAAQTSSPQQNAKQDSVGAVPDPKPVTDAAAEPGGPIGDIVVTAQRRAESLQRVPVSVEVVSQEAIRAQNIVSLVSLARQNPSIKVQGSGRSSNFYIRGTGSGESQAFDQSVGTFIDDIYHGRSRFSEATFLDIDRVEILKGPQSTFFGNNAIAGAINITTVKPGDDISGFMRALISPTSGENGGQYALEGAITLPVTQDFGVRVAGTMNGQRGYLRNVNTGRFAPNQDNFAFRATARYAPGAGFDVTLKGEYGENINKGGLVLRQTFCPPDAPFTAAGFCAINLAAGAPNGLDSSRYTSNAGNLIKLKTGESVLTVNYDLGGPTLTSVSGYYGYNFLLNLDNDGTARELLNVQAPERYRQFSQELRLASATGGTFDYLAGLYYQGDKLDIRQDVGFFFLTPNLASPAVFAPLRPFLPIGQSVTAVQREDVYSAFGSLTFNASERLKFEVGLRGSITKKRFDWALALGTASQSYGAVAAFPAALQRLAGAIGIGTPGTVKLSRTDKALLPSARVQYELADDVMAYVSYTRGFKAGGFSVAELSANPANYPFAPEFVNAYETGLKSRFLDRRLLLNLAAFRNDFSDLQVVINGTNAAGAPVNFVRNAASSRAQGVELEAQAVLSDLFRLSASGTYLDSTYRRYPNAGATYAQQFAAIQAGRNPSAAVQDLSGKHTLYAPRWSGTVTGTLTVPVSTIKLTAEATGIFSSSYHTIFTLDPLADQGGYSRLDARVSIEAIDGRLAFDVIGKNLTNTTVLTFSGYQPNSRGSFFQDRQPFRNVAFQVRYKF